MKRSAIKDWRFALLLTLPITIFFVAYLLNHSQGLSPTGFIQYDNVAYIAYARQYLDAGAFHLAYSNPFSDHASSLIYFQPQTLFFALLLKMGVSPGWILIPFSIICSVICFRLLISIYDLLFAQDKYRRFFIWLFAWGGGLLVIAGAFSHFFLRRPGSFWQDLFLLDPEHGWWGLNIGRSLLFSCEAYYHALFLGCMYCLLQKKWIGASAVMLILILSHPFTGIELLGIVCFWMFIEFTRDKKAIPPWFILISILYVGLYVYYYLVYLNTFPEHRSVADQYSLNWRLGLYRIVPAYLLVGVLAIAAIYKKRFQTFFRSRANRLFACWFLIAFLLANHEWFMKPRQPIHFTRGYIWASLFLLGLPALRKLTEYLENRRGKIAVAIIAVVFLLDNFLWIGVHSTATARDPGASYITPEQWNVIKILDKEATNSTLVLSDDETISYLSTVYTKAYPWFSHPYTTPFAALKQSAFIRFLQTGKIDSAWLGRNLLFVLKKNGAFQNPQLMRNEINITGENQAGSYLILRSDSLYMK